MTARELTFRIDGRTLPLETIEAVAREGARIEIAPQARERVRRARETVDRGFAGGEAIYGITTGFGRLANARIDPADAAQLQLNLVRSHAAGTGEPLPEAQVRAALLLRASALAAGHSGVAPETLDLQVELLNRGVTPIVPCQGSVGASGDLAPLAHMTLILIGEGEALFAGERLPGAEALRRAGLEPVSLRAKEGLSLINGTQVMTGIASLALLRAERLLLAADAIGAMSVEAFLATDSVYDPRINGLRPHRGQGAVADHVRALLAGSEIMRSHRSCGRVQDPYSFRAIPVVHGAARDTAAHVRSVIEVEAVSVTDNPLIFPDDNEFLAGANFHGEPVALVSDFLKIAMTEVASMSERRSYLLLNGAERDLPLFLSRKPGLESGLMIVQYTAAALVSESKSSAFPASVDSIPTSAGQEDHVSMGTIAARILDRVLDNVEGVLACELLCALAATDFRRPLRSGAGTAYAYDAARAVIPPLVTDRAYDGDIAAARHLLRSRALLAG
jgi:histidine ammonia-lyase